MLGESKCAEVRGAFLPLILLLVLLSLARGRLCILILVVHHIIAVVFMKRFCRHVFGGKSSRHFEKVVLRQGLCWHVLGRELRLVATTELGKAGVVGVVLILSLTIVEISLEL